MSDKVIKFNKGNNEEENEPCCESCGLAQEYFYILLDTLKDGSFEDAYGVIRELVEQAKDLALIDYLQNEINHKAEILDALVYGVDED